MWPGWRSKGCPEENTGIENREDRPVGRPQRKWEEKVAEDARKLLGLRNWKRAAREKDGWGEELKEVKSRKRGVAPTEEVVYIKL